VPPMFLSLKFQSKASTWKFSTIAPRSSHTCIPCWAQQRSNMGYSYWCWKCMKT
jgi:hypothetical protein